MNKQKSILTAAILTAGAIYTAAAHAVLIVNTTSYSYFQDFNSLASSGLANSWTNDSTLSG